MTERQSFFNNSAGCSQCLLVFCTSVYLMPFAQDALRGIERVCNSGLYFVCLIFSFKELIKGMTLENHYGNQSQTFDLIKPNVTLAQLSTMCCNWKSSK